eukprot:6208291-Pleurochrysis_carterae.AAC.2
MLDRMLVGASSSKFKVRGMGVKTPSVPTLAGAAATNRAALTAPRGYPTLPVVLCTRLLCLQGSESDSSLSFGVI